MLWGLAASLGGGLAGSLGDKLGESLGLTPDTRETPGFKGMQAGMEELVKQGPGLTQAGMFNQAGQTGAEVKKGFQSALDALTNSAQARQTANSMRDYGNTALENVQTQTAVAQQMAQNQLGNTRKDAMSSLSAGGASPAAMAGAMSQLGAGAQQGAMGVLGQSTGAMQSALGLAGQMQRGAQDTLSKDLGQRNQIYVDPYKAQVNNLTPLAQQMVQTGAESATQARTNPLAGLSSGLGMIGAGSIKRDWNERPQGESDVKGMLNELMSMYGGGR